MQILARPVHNPVYCLFSNLRHFPVGIYELFSLGRDKPCIAMSQCCLLQCKQMAHNVYMPRLYMTLFVSEPVSSENQQLKID